jgi:hypothetical protein
MHIANRIPNRTHTFVDPNDMEQTPLTPEQQEYLNDYHAWLEQRPEKISVPYVFHSQLVLILREDESSLDVKAEYANDINYVEPRNAQLMMLSMAKNLVKSFEKDISESINK